VEDMNKAIIINQDVLKDEILDRIEKITVDIMEVYQVELDQSKRSEQIKRLQDSIKMLIEIREALSECCNAPAHGWI
jgi:REP element-mobilizing transposase RayT